MKIKLDINNIFESVIKDLKGQLEIQSLNGGALWNTFDVAIKLLEGVQEREKGCGYCNGEGIVSFVYHPTNEDWGMQDVARFCPMCGKKLCVGEAQKGSL